jgi:hypothetical protein
METGQWFKSYLNGRKQKAEIKSPNSNYNTYSNWGFVKHGVLKVQYLVLCFSSYVSMIYPQPSILNPNPYSSPMIYGM